MTEIGLQNEIRKLGWQIQREARNGTSAVHAQDRLSSPDGQLVDSRLRAETIAESLESVQWAVHPTSLTEKQPLFPDLEMSDDKITYKEQRRATQNRCPSNLLYEDLEQGCESFSQYHQVKSFCASSVFVADQHPFNQARQIIIQSDSQFNNFIVTLLNPILKPTAVYVEHARPAKTRHNGEEIPQEEN